MGANQNTTARVTPTKAERWTQQEQCYDAFLTSGINPFLTQHVLEDGRPKEKLRQRLVTSDNGQIWRRYLPARNWVSLPHSDAKKGTKFAAQLRRCWPATTDVWTGIATEGPRCTVDVVRSRSRILMNTVRKFFADQERFNGLKLMFAVVQSPVRSRWSRKLHKNSNGQLLYHVHVHMLFTMAEGMDQRRRALAALRRKFGNTFQRVKNRHAAITYLTATQDRSDILSHGEFVSWHEQVQRLPRMRLYAAFRIKRPRVRRCQRCKTTAPNYHPNKFIARFKRYGKPYVVWENPDCDPRIVYEKENVARLPDDHNSSLI